MFLKIITFCVLFVGIATVVSSDSLKPPQWVEDEPWIPHYVECEFNLEVKHHGPECYDCNSVMHCTPIGGFVRSCWTPDEPYCNRGKCSAKISEECAAIPVKPVVPEYFENEKVINQLEMLEK